jgi:hypothetical protein
MILFVLYTVLLPLFYTLIGVAVISYQQQLRTNHFPPRKLRARCRESQMKIDLQEMIYPHPVNMYIYVFI